jgi:hypothetical protein
VKHTFACTIVAALVAAGAGVAQVPETVTSMIERNAEMGLERYPIGFWNYTNLAAHGQYMDEAEIEEWADAGFTLTMTPNFDASNWRQVEHMRRILDWAHARGMKLILCDPRTYSPHQSVGVGREAIPDSHREGIANAVKTFGDHPGLFGFHIGDEPGVEANEAFFAAYRATKRAAPNLHPFMNFLPWYPGVSGRVGYDTWPEYLDAAVAKADLDFLCWDCYAQMNPGLSGWDMYYKNLRLYREAAWRHGIPFWNTVLSVGHFNYRCPSFNDLRWQFNTTVASGASGVLWFFYYMREPHSNYRLSPVDEHWDRTETYYDLRRIQKSFHRQYGDLFLRLAPVRVTFAPEPFGDGDVFTPNEVVSAIDSGGKPVLIGEFADSAGQRYVMVVNNSTEENARVAVTFPGKDVQLHSWQWNGTEQPGHAYSADSAERTEAGVTVWHWLAPGQEAVYRVESELTRLTPVTIQAEKGE